MDVLKKLEPLLHLRVNPNDESLRTTGTPMSSIASSSDSNASEENKKESQDDESQDDESQDDESQDDESQDDESQDDESQDDESQDDENQDDGSQNDESPDDESQDEKAESTPCSKKLVIIGGIESPETSEGHVTTLDFVDTIPTVTSNRDPMTESFFGPVSLHSIFPTPRTSAQHILPHGWKSELDVDDRAGKLYWLL